MDGTLCDYARALCASLDELWSPDEPRIYPIYGVRHPDYIQARINLIRNQPGWWRELKPLPLGFRVLELAQDAGYRVAILTQGPKSSPNAYTEKYEWKQHHLPDDDIGVTITRDKGGIYSRVLVDDHPPYLQAWLKHRPRGLAIIPDQPWNQDFEHPQVVRATLDNLDDVKQALLRARDGYGT